MTVRIKNMRYLNILCFQFCLLLFFFLPAFAGMAANQSADEFAGKSLSVYTKTLLTEQTAGKFGFKTLAEAQSATLGRPLAVKTVGLGSIKAYQPGSGVQSLESQMSALWYPVLVERRVLAKLEIVEIKGKMVSGDFGAASEAKRVDKVARSMTDRIKKKNLGHVTDKMIFRVPHLKAIFFHLKTSRGEYLVPAMALPQRFNLENGEVYDADVVLKRLKAHAAEIPEDLIR